jgi:hypothetical protein
MFISPNIIIIKFIYAQLTDLAFLLKTAMLSYKSTLMQSRVLEQVLDKPDQNVKCAQSGHISRWTNLQL